MRSGARPFDRPWVMPESCPPLSGIPRPSSDLRSAIERAEDALEARSIGRLARALVVLRATLRSRATQGDAEHDAHLGSPWNRRLRRRYAASMCAIERLLETAWATCDFDAVQAEAEEELARLRRLESLEDAAHLDRHWTDLGVGD